MKILFKLAIILFLLVIIYQWTKPKEKMNQKKETEIIVEVKRSDGIHKLDINTYLIGVVGSEMSPTYEKEALKAQCVAARTFVCARNYQVDDSVNSQVYRDESQLKQQWGKHFNKYYQKLKEVVQETEDEILTYDGQPISALFHAQSCGKTANSQDYFQTAYPYLQSVESTSDIQEDDFIQTMSFDIETFMQALKLDEAPFYIATPIRYESGYVQSWEMNGQIFSGREVREALGLRSSAFEVQFDGNQFTFTTKGYGHGVGMSQRGANAMAKEGFNYQQILKHYYQGVEITKPLYKLQ